MKVLVPTASCLSPGVPAQWAKVDIVLAQWARAVLAQWVKAVLAQWAKAVLAQWAKVVYVLDVLLLQAEGMTKIVSFACCRLRKKGMLGYS
jgi:hypothetical protein